MRDMKKWLLPLAMVAASATYAQAATAPEVSGTIVSEASVDCGSKAGHKTSLDLLCQEYIVRTASADYHVRQPKPENQNLIPINTKVQFTLDKSKMKFKFEGKSYEYVVVSETAGSGQS
jgi:hypothetical protein